jgi:hypothetical protein
MQYFLKPSCVVIMMMIIIIGEFSTLNAVMSQDASRLPTSANVLTFQ